MNGYKVVVTKSTVPTGTGQMIEQIMREKNGRHEFSVVSNPEFLREGSAVARLPAPRPRRHRRVATRAPIEIMKEIYSPLYLLETPFVITDVASAELIKYASNGFLAVKISFINEVARLCELDGRRRPGRRARAWGSTSASGEVPASRPRASAAPASPRTRRPPPTSRASTATTSEIIEATMRVNARTKARMIEKIARRRRARSPGKTAAVLGLSFKPETDDIRESPALAVVADLRAGGRARPRLRPGRDGRTRRRRLPATPLRRDAYDCAAGADFLVLATEWNEFRALDLGELGERLKSRTMIDLRNVYDPKEMRAAGLALRRRGHGPDGHASRDP